MAEVDGLAAALGRAAQHAAKHSKAPATVASAPKTTFKSKGRPKTTRKAPAVVKPTGRTRPKPPKVKATPSDPFPMQVVLRPVPSSSLPRGVRFDQLEVGKTFRYREAYVRGWDEEWVKVSDTHYQLATGGTPYRAPLDCLVLEQSQYAKKAA